MRPIEIKTTNTDIKQYHLGISKFKLIRSNEVDSLVLSEPTLVYVVGSRTSQKDFDKINLAIKEFLSNKTDLTYAGHKAALDVDVNLSECLLTIAEMDDLMCAGFNPIYYSSNRHKILLWGNIVYDPSKPAAMQDALISEYATIKMIIEMAWPGVNVYLDNNNRDMAKALFDDALGQICFQIIRNFAIDLKRIQIVDLVLEIVFGTDTREKCYYVNLRESKQDTLNQLPI